jgi:glycosyltransferase involved in cell wall biosynthesis
MRPPVLHVIPYLWSGAGGVLTRLCEAQRRRGPVAIVTSGGHGANPDWPAYRARLRRAGVAHHTIDFYDRGAFWSSANQLADLMRELKPAIVHAHAGVPCCGAVVAREMSGHRARVIGQMYSWGPDRPEWMNHQDMWGFGQTDRVVCSARAYWDLLVQYGVPARKLAYLPWGLPLERLPYRGDIAVSGGWPVIGFVGRIERRKGQLDLINAFARVRRSMKNGQLELVGPVADRTYAAQVRRAIAASGLRGAVTIAGEVRDIATHVRRWDLFVSLSSDEGQGLAVLEAMALGVPVLARPVAGIADFLIEGRTGLAVEGSSAAGVAGAILSALSSRSRLRWITRHARRLVERRYAWDRTVAGFDRVYRA